jgi:glycosyltransferase involved in cell wall biosynthesis
VKALVIAPQPFFSPRGTPFSVYYRTLVTAELGVQVDLLTYGEGQDVEIENVRIIRIPRFGFLGNVKVGPSLLKAFLDMFIILWTIALLVRNRYDYVHAHEEAIFFCLFLKPLFRFKLVYDMHSSLPQQLTNFRFTTSRILIGAFRRLERMSLRASNAVITICPDLADYALSEIDDPSKHVLIENSIFDPVRLSEPAQPVRTTESESGMVDLPQGRPLIVYAGTLEPYQGIDLLLQAFRSVLKHIPEAFLLVVGGNPGQLAHYSSLAKDLGIDAACTFTGQVPPMLAKDYCARAQVLVSPRTSGTNTPLKVYEQLASGIPLVATHVYSHTQVLDDTVAFLAEPESESLSRSIVTALTDSVERARRAQSARRLYEEKYSRTAYVGKMRQLLKRLG